MIEEPRIIVALTTKDGRTSIEVRRTDADDAQPKDIRSVSWPLVMLAPAGYMAACDRVGNAVWRLLHAAHPELLEPHPPLKPPDMLTELEEIIQLVQTLIRRSVREQTSSYVPALDAIFKSNADLLEKTSLPEQWPTLRSSFMRHSAT
ncbi:hypothetical protein CR105_21380 [Massilia eurypsychrophila]|jgi:hypothetical protein|uniref:Uncharacterized protein n=1 Tax=Massilia eurypsychrophila TaxID=1485217 RepID=A0A2G8TAB5_9BURK|nr:hypothetical protein [Massilia eurypsychrophila]PIL42919.1 hypothetical protein CR105_21380 [Massilia eurypsychrophila]